MSAAEHLEPDETDRFLAALPLEKFRDTKQRRESLALLRAVRLARDLETCEMILAQGRAPKSRLDPKWAKAYGLA
jgi:hypothetical protein